MHEKQVLKWSVFSKSLNLNICNAKDFLHFLLFIQLLFNKSVKQCNMISNNTHN